jgi:hypothetical protein
MIWSKNDVLQNYNIYTWGSSESARNGESAATRRSRRHCLLLRNIAGDCTRRALLRRREQHGRRRRKRCGRTPREWAWPRRRERARLHSRQQSMCCGYENTYATQQRTIRALRSFVYTTCSTSARSSRFAREAHKATRAAYAGAHSSAAARGSRRELAHEGLFLMSRPPSRISALSFHHSYFLLFTCSWRSRTYKSPLLSHIVR